MMLAASKQCAGTIHHVFDVVEVVGASLSLRRSLDDLSDVLEEHQGRLLGRTNETRTDFVLNAFRVRPLDVLDVQASPLVAFPDPYLERDDVEHHKRPIECDSSSVPRRSCTGNVDDRDRIPDPQVA